MCVPSTMQNRQVLFEQKIFPLRCDKFFVCGSLMRIIWRQTVPLWKPIVHFTSPPTFLLEYSHISVPLKWPPRSELRSIIPFSGLIKNLHCLVCPCTTCVQTINLMISLINSLFTQRNLFFPWEPLDQSEISALPESKLRQFLWASWGGATSPLMCFAYVPNSFLHPLLPKRLLHRLFCIRYMQERMS